MSEVSAAVEAAVDAQIASGDLVVCDCSCGATLDSREEYAAHRDHLVEAVTASFKGARG